MQPKPTKWTAISIDANAEAAEAIEFALNSLDALGTQIDYMQKPTDEVRIVGYFERLPNDETIQDELHYALRSYGLDENALISIEKSEIEDTDWLAEWKKHWQPTTVGRFVIAPPWIAVDNPEKIVIRIEPNMAFGTGTHETTQLCLQAIDEFYTPGNSFLDVGTGTGILTIAAAMLTGGNTSGSECALVGSDTDFEAIKIARENAILNGVAGQVEFFDGSLTNDTPQFDFVCANLTLDVIQPILSLLLAKSVNYLVLSGILTEQRNAILRSLSKNGINDPLIWPAGEWICVVLKK